MEMIERLLFQLFLGKETPERMREHSKHSKLPLERFEPNWDQNFSEDHEDTNLSQ